MVKNTLVMKFGGASVVAPQNFSRVAEIICQRQKQYGRIAVVVSAMGKTTDALISLAKEVHPEPPSRELDMLISTGERVSIALLAMALALRGVKALSFTGSQSGIKTTAEHAEARIVAVSPHRLTKALEEGAIVIVAGFQGVSVQGEITTLGRGGSDTTAVALGVALRSEKVEFFKDVGGIFSEDPKKNARAQHYSSLTYQEAYTIASEGAKVLHQRCIALAEKNGLPLQVIDFQDVDGLGTWIGRGSVRQQNPLYET